MTVVGLVSKCPSPSVCTFQRPPAALPALGTVEALYDCDPDRSDELMFKEGERIIVMAKLNNDWWVSSRFRHFSFHCHLLPASFAYREDLLMGRKAVRGCFQSITCEK